MFGNPTGLQNSDSNILFLGCLAVLWFLLWCLIVAESPAKHPSISNKELEYIQGSIGYTDEQTQVGFC